jgi:uncharacterized protein (TIGR03067 family)
VKRSLLFLLAVCCLPRAQATVGADAKAEIKKLQGVWRPMKLERGGKVVRDAFLPGARFVVDGAALRLKVGDKTLQELRLTLDPSQEPAAVDLTAASGPTRGKTALGIYRLEGERLTLCWPLADDSRRPTTFRGKGDKDVAVLTLERE